MDVDVLIVGAGPTGLMHANQLGRRGVRALVVDRNAGRSTHTKALVVHARTLEIYPGMNTGLQDAYNLAWKLALVVSGRAAGTLLDSYELERIPVAERLLRTTDQAFSLIVSDRWLAGLFRTRVLARILAFAMRRDRTRKLAFRTISQIGTATGTAVCQRRWRLCLTTHRARAIDFRGCG